MQPVRTTDDVTAGMLEDVLTSATTELLLVIAGTASPLHNCLEKLIGKSALEAPARLVVGGDFQLPACTKADVRMTASTCMEFAVADSRTAVVLPCGDAAGVRVTETALVRLARSHFEEMWQQAVPVAGDQLTVDIFRCLASGLTDEVAAREMHISLRTYRRRVADIMRTVGASSRFQAGLLAAHRGIPHQPT
jgi:hypothetical protein